MTMMMAFAAVVAGIDLMWRRDMRNGIETLEHIAAVAARSMLLVVAAAESATVARRTNRPSDPTPPRPLASHPNQNYHSWPHHSRTPHYYFSKLEVWSCGCVKQNETARPENLRPPAGSLDSKQMQRKKRPRKLMWMLMWGCSSPLCKRGPPPHRSHIAGERTKSG